MNMASFKYPYGHWEDQARMGSVEFSVLSDCYWNGTNPDDLVAAMSCWHIASLTVPLDDGHFFGMRHCQALDYTRDGGVKMDRKPVTLYRAGSVAVMHASGHRC